MTHCWPWLPTLIAAGPLPAHVASVSAFALRIELVNNRTAQRDAADDDAAAREWELAMTRTVRSFVSPYFIALVVSPGEQKKKPNFDPYNEPWLL